MTMTVRVYLTQQHTMLDSIVHQIITEAVNNVRCTFVLIHCIVDRFIYFGLWSRCGSLAVVKSTHLGERKFQYRIFNVLFVSLLVSNQQIKKKNFLVLRDLEFMTLSRDIRPDFQQGSGPLQKSTCFRYI